jgi:hypothetical protein
MRTPAGTRWLRSLAIASWVLAGLLAGCSDPQKPASLPTASRSTGATRTPSPTVTPVEQQVEAAVRAYYAELTHAAQTNDTTRLKTMIVKTCPCYRAIRVIEENRRQGERIPDIAIKLVSVRVHDVVARSASAEVKTEDAPYDVVGRDGKVTDRIKASSTHLDLSLLLTKSGVWVVANFFNLQG